MMQIPFNTIHSSHNNGEYLHKYKKHNNFAAALITLTISFTKTTYLHEKSNFINS